MTVSIFTAGACESGTEIGGWGVLIKMDSKKAELFGGRGQATANQMELVAVIEALKFLPDDCGVALTTSHFVMSGLVHWDSANDDRELWFELGQQVKRHDIWVKLAADNIDSSRANSLARKGIEQFLSV